MKPSLAVSPETPLTPGAAPPVGELLEQLAALHAALRELAELAGAKLTAMRRADVPRLQAITAREGPLLDGLFRSEPVRKATLARVAQALPCVGSQPPCLSAIAERLAEPARSALRARMTALQAAASDLQQKNRLAARVARNLQSHIRGVFAAIAGVSTAPVYGPKGQTATAGGRCWVDAVG